MTSYWDNSLANDEDDAILRNIGIEDDILIAPGTPRIENVFSLERFNEEPGNAEEEEEMDTPRIENVFSLERLNEESSNAEEEEEEMDFQDGQPFILNYPTEEPSSAEEEEEEMENGDNQNALQESSIAEADPLLAWRVNDHFNDEPLHENVDIEKECSICGEDQVDFLMRCKHWFHLNCIKNWCLSHCTHCAISSCRRRLCSRWPKAATSAVCHYCHLIEPSTYLREFACGHRMHLQCMWSEQIVTRATCPNCRQGILPLNFF